MRLSNVRRIIVEDFKQEDRDAASRLAFILNNFMEEVVELSNGNITYDNMDRTKIDFELTVNAQGVPLGNNKVATNLPSVSGSKVINVVNLTNAVAYASGHPFIFFSPLGGGLIQINKVVGLNANQKYRLSVEFIA